jgi:pectate lyase
METMMINFRALLFFGLVSMSSCGNTQNLSLEERGIAFPGAEGFGKFTTGGRGGKVYIVTNLNDDGQGSLREAIRKKEPRIITFAVSGTIALQSPLDINYGDLTIAGQSAPGDGICLRNYPMKIKAGNVIVRYMRFRLGDEKAQQDDAISATRQENIIIDHCSMSWATDECASFYGNKDFTLQWCIIAESLNESVHAKGDHGYGGIWGGQKATFHHNLMAHHNSRLPRFSGSKTTPNSPEELVDFSNNVVYNWMNNNSYGGEKGRYNMVNNYYKPGPATAKSKRDRLVNPSQPYGTFFLQGNYLHGNPTVSVNNKLGIVADHVDSTYTTKSFNVMPIRLQAADKAFEMVLQQVGVSHKRDQADARLIREVKEGIATNGKNKNGVIDSPEDVGGWPVLQSLPAATDTDQDGMPDAWELKHKLNPKEANDNVLFSLNKYYTNIEMYLNGLVD